MAAQCIGGRWFERPVDGIIFRMDDPDHIKRMLAEGWHEVDGPHTQAPIAPLPDALPADAMDVEAVDIPATIDAFIGTVPGQHSLVKPLKRVRRADDAERRR